MKTVTVWKNTRFSFWGYQLGLQYSHASARLKGKKSCWQPGLVVVISLCGVPGWHLMEQALWTPGPWGGLTPLKATPSVCDFGHQHTLKAVMRYARREFCPEAGICADRAVRYWHGEQRFFEVEFICSRGAGTPGLGLFEVQSQGTSPVVARALHRLNCWTRFQFWISQAASRSIARALSGVPTAGASWMQNPR